MLRQNFVAGAILAAGTVLLTMAAPVTAAAHTAPAQCTAAAPTSVAANSELGVAALYKKHVKSNTQSVRVFRSATGSLTWGTWGPCTNFWTDRTDGNRYHTWVWINGTRRDAWVTSNSDYIAGGWCG